MTTLITGGRVLTCETEDVLERGAILIEGDRISWVGAMSEAPDVADHVIDVGGRTVMPGLVDAHMHISFGEARTEEELQIYSPIAHRAVRASVDAEKVLLAGVTSATDPGGPRGVALAVRDAITAGLVQGPRLSVAGRQMSTQQGIGATMPEWLGQLDQSFGALVTSLDDIRQEIRNDVKDGVDLIKVAVSGPGTTEHAAMSLDELTFAVSEAHAVDRPVTVHARSRKSVTLAVDAGVDWIMHASYMDEPTLARVVDAGTPVVPALTLLVNSIEATPGYYTPAMLDGVRRELEAAVGILSMARDAGVSLIAGSESGFGMTPYGQWHARELQIFVEYLGMRHHEALLCMTRNAAVACPRYRDSVGTLTAGKFADILVVDGKPDENVRLLQDPANFAAIYKGGSEVKAWRPSGASRTRMVGESARRYVDDVFLPDRSAAGASLPKLQGRV
jgi:imidazolonepropionase-like amidohydrolase